MLIQLNYKSGKPVYLQVVDQIKSATASGALRSGESLPSIRPLAEQLRINRNNRGQGVCGVGEPGSHRNDCGQGLVS